MGAAASVTLVYRDAILWFRKYFDCETYVQDFNSMDRDHSGGVSYLELTKWLTQKAEAAGGAWRFMISHPEIIAIAHSQACGPSKCKFRSRNAIVDLNDFRSLLIQLFAISIFWVHFKKADEWQHSDDAFNERLSAQEFTTAIRSLCAVYGQEMLSEEQLLADFAVIDTNQSGSVSLLEVCNFCCRFIDSTHAEKFVLGQELAKAEEQAQKVVENDLLAPQTSSHRSAVFWSGSAEEKPAPITVLTELLSPPSEAEVQEAGLAAADDGLPTADPTQAAVEIMMREIEKNERIAEFVEMKLATTQALQQEGF